MNKKITIGIIIVIIVLFGMVYDNKGKIRLSNGYCKEGDGCCGRSYEFITKSNYKIIKQDEKCLDGYQKNMLLCATSLKWCEPSKKIISNNVVDNKIPECEEITIIDSKDRCYLEYSMSRNNVDLCKMISSDDMKKNCYNNFKKVTENTPILNALGSDPHAISINKKTDILFTVMQSGFEDKANKVVVEELDSSGVVIRELGQLNDNGLDGDLGSGDYVYSGKINIFSDKEGFLYFRAKADYANYSNLVYTSIYKLGTTRFPINTYSSDLSKTVIDPKTGGKIISNEVIVKFKEGVTPDRIEKIVKEIDGEVIGTIFGLGYYQIKISNTGDATGVNNAIDLLLKYSEVEIAEPNGIAEISI